MKKLGKDASFSNALIAKTDRKRQIHASIKSSLKGEGIYDYNRTFLPNHKFYFLSAGDKFNLKTREPLPKRYV